MNDEEFKQELDDCFSFFEDYELINKIIKQKKNNIGRKPSWFKELSQNVKNIYDENEVNNYLDNNSSFFDTIMDNIKKIKSDDFKTNIFSDNILNTDAKTVFEAIIEKRHTKGRKPDWITRLLENINDKDDDDEIIEYLSKNQHIISGLNKTKPKTKRKRYQDLWDFRNLIDINGAIEKNMLQNLMEYEEIKNDKTINLLLKKKINEKSIGFSDFEIKILRNFFFNLRLL